MDNNPLIPIEVAYAKPERQSIISLQVEPHCSIEEAIKKSGILLQFPEIDLNKQAVGVFSQPKQLSDTLFAGDRIEIYRPLMIDPKEARRQKARKTS